MKYTIFFVLLISACLAEEEETVQQRPSRAPQGHLQYSDPDGLKVSWKLYAPYTQWKSHLDNPQRNQRAESGTAQPTLPSHTELIKPVAEEKAAQPAQPVQPVQPVQQAQQVQFQYKPYSMVPSHIKQLIYQMYEPQGPYVDPAVYIYRANEQQQEEQSQQEAAPEHEESAQATSQSQQSHYEHIPAYQTKYSQASSKVGYIQYKDEQPTAEESAAPQYGAVPERHEAAAEEPQQDQPSSIDDGMPKALHQLLNLQAQTPYHVIANRIVYKPKSIFVPKPFTEDTKGPYKYRSKIYYLKDEDVDAKGKERPEREERQQYQEQEYQQQEYKQQEQPQQEYQQQYE